MNVGRKHILRDITIIIIQIGILWQVSWAVTSIRHNLISIDTKIQEENVITFQKYLDDRLQNLKMMVVGAKYDDRLYGYIQNNDYTQISNNILSKLIEIDGVYYVGIVASDVDDGSDDNYYTTEKVKGIVYSMKDEIQILHDTYSGEYLDYYVYNNEVFMVYIVPVYQSRENLIQPLVGDQKYLIFLRQVNDQFISRQGYILGFDPFVITLSDISSNKDVIKGDKYASNNIKRDFANEDNYFKSYKNSIYTYQQKNYYNKNNELLFVTQIRNYSYIDLYLFSSYFVLLMVQIIIQMLLIVFVIVWQMGKDDGNNNTYVNNYDNAKKYLNNITERKEERDQQLSKQIENRSMISRSNIL